VRPISQASEHAIRALTHLARRHGEGYQLAQEMARELRIPAPFLAKILRPLVDRGVLASQRGRGGGFRLARPPGEVSLFDVVDSQEHLGRRRCFLGQAECTDERACPMHDYWRDASERWQSTLAGTTLQDLVDFCAASPDSGYPAPGPGRRAR